MSLTSTHHSLSPWRGGGAQSSNDTKDFQNP